jgi:hypothetical protein
MAGIGFSSGGSVELARELFQSEAGWAENALFLNEQKCVRVEAVSRVLAAYVTVSGKAPDAAVLHTWVTQIDGEIGRLFQ